MPDGVGSISRRNCLAKFGKVWQTMSIGPKSVWEAVRPPIDHRLGKMWDTRRSEGIVTSLGREGMESFRMATGLCCGVVKITISDGLTVFGKWSFSAGTSFVL